VPRARRFVRLILINPFFARNRKCLGGNPGPDIVTVSRACDFETTWTSRPGHRWEFRINSSRTGPES